MTENGQATADHLQRFRSALNDLDADVPALDLDHARRTLRDAEDVYRNLAAVIDTLKSRVYELLPSDVTEYTADDGLPPITRSWTGASEKWENGDDLARLVAARSEEEWYDRESGETKPPAVIADAAARAIAKAHGMTASKAWRKSELTALGVDPKAFLRREGGRPTVRWL